MATKQYVDYTEEEYFDAEVSLDGEDIKLTPKNGRALDIEGEITINGVVPGSSSFGPDSNGNLLNGIDNTAGDDAEFGLVSGVNNTIEDRCNSVIASEHSTASGFHSSVISSHNSTASGDGAVVIGCINTTGDKANTVYVENLFNKGVDYVNTTKHGTLKHTQYAEIVTLAADDSINYALYGITTNEIVVCLDYTALSGVTVTVGGQAATSHIILTPSAPVVLNVAADSEFAGGTFFFKADIYERNSADSENDGE